MACKIVTSSAGEAAILRINAAEIKRVLEKTLVGSAVEATFRVRALTEIADTTTRQLCAISAAVEALRSRR